MWVVRMVCALAAIGAGAGTEEVAPGTPIVAVRIERHDIYDLDDPATSAWPYRWIDALHILTREEFNRFLLFFRVREILDPEIVAAVPNGVMSQDSRPGTTGRGLVTASP
jgi:hypothetical protein